MRNRNRSPDPQKQAGVALFRVLKRMITPLRAVRRLIDKRASLRASVTVEASIALPLYIFFFVNILTAFDILRMQDDLTAALHQTGNHIAFHAFDVKYAGDMLGSLNGGGDDTDSFFDEAGTAIYSVAYAGSEVRKYLGEDYLNSSCIEGGSSGLNFLRSRIMVRADEIELVVSYRVKPFLPGLIAFESYGSEARYFGHAWTGYEPGGAGNSIGTEDDPIVYVTENGTVYHRNLNCTHLKHAVRSVSVAEARSATNNSGKSYTPCEICGGYTNGHGTAYISDGGDRIHSTVNCPGLKRTIYYVHLSEVAGRMPPCSKCGGG